MLKKFIRKYHICFKHENRFNILSVLLVNLFVEKLWKLKKSILGIKSPIIHVYTICWNEEKIIPFFLSHYNELVSHYYVYDNFSDDNSDELFSKQSNITVEKYKTDGKINDLVYQNIKNNAWKKSRGSADWVIVIDMDELIYHPRLLTLLTDKKSQVTIFKPTGYDMVSSDFPTNCTSIVEGVKYGVRKPNMDKCVLFNPHRIVDINYLPGAHECNPDGIVVFSTDIIKLLHYKYLGIDYVLNRINLYRKRLSKENIENEYGIEYLREMDVVREDFDNKIANCQLVVD